MLYKPNDQNVLLAGRCPASASAPTQPSLLLWGAGGCAWICAPTPAGNAGRELPAHTDQSTRGLVSPNQLLKHYSDDGGCGAYTGAKHTKHPKVAGKATVAAGEWHWWVTKDACSPLSCWLGAPGEPAPWSSCAIG